MVSAHAHAHTHVSVFAREGTGGEGIGAGGEVDLAERRRRESLRALDGVCGHEDGREPDAVRAEQLLALGPPQLGDRLPATETGRAAML